MTKTAYAFQRAAHQFLRETEDMDMKPSVKREVRQAFERFCRRVEPLFSKGDA